MFTAVCTTLLLLSTAIWRETLAGTRYDWHVAQGREYNYDPNIRDPRGVYNWPYTYREQCGGEYQSPVDIRTDMVVYNSPACSCPVLTYDYPVIFGEFENNGHSAVFIAGTSHPVRLTNVPHRSGMYIFHDFHFHYGGTETWGGRDWMHPGSEHTMDGVRFDGEMHFVFYNNKYASLEQADDKYDGVVVLSLLIQQIPLGVPASADTVLLSRFLRQHIPAVQELQASTSAIVDLQMFFNRRCEYYTYRGSTTTPFCFESVQWLVFKEPIRVYEDAWHTLTTLRSTGDYNTRFGNNRYVVPMHGRVIEANFHQPRFNTGQISSGSKMFPMSAPKVQTFIPAGNPTHGKVRSTTQGGFRIPAIHERVRSIKIGRPIVKFYTTGKMAPMLYKLKSLRARKNLLR